MNKPVRVQWHVEALIECPHCEMDNNFMDVDEFWVYTKPMESKKNFFSPVRIECEHCKKEFLVDGADY